MAANPNEYPDIHIQCDGDGEQDPMPVEVVDTMFGKVKIIKTSAGVPAGWRVLSNVEGKQIKPQLNQLIGTWSIVAFDTGKLAGFGYGNNFEETYGEECGETFVVQSAAAPAP